MKKNFVTVITLVLVLVNLVLTLILTITIIPEAKQANALITKVCSAIDLDLESGSATSNANVPIDQIELHNIADKMTINLKTGADGKQHVAVLTVSISMDKEHEDYKDLSPQVASKEDLIKAEINNIVSSYTVEEIRDNQDAVQKEILKDLQRLFASDFIVAVGFPSVQYQ